MQPGQTTQTTVNPLDEELKAKIEGLKIVEYNDKEREYASFLQARLMTARTKRQQNFDEFDGMDFLTYNQSNSKGANSFITPKKNKEDTNFVTGTTRQALLALIAKINALNLFPEIKAFNTDNIQDKRIGQAIEDIVFECGVRDNDEEKMLLRQYELYSQGTVFVEEYWKQEFRTKKDYDYKNYKGQIQDVKWDERLELIFEGCCRNVIPGPNVYLGSMNVFDMEQQPYVFTVDVIPYEDARAIYGQWERWQYVTNKKQSFSGDVQENGSILYNTWRFSNDTQDNQCEVIKYQDKWSNEYMIIINGVMMMPVGFPLPWEKPRYNITKQIFEVLSTNFPYGGSLVKRLKVAQGLEDEFWRLAILKTQGSFRPAMGNLTGKVISQRVFMPGKITAGLNPDQLKPLYEVDGVSQSEVQMLTMLKANLNDNSMPRVSQGQQPAGEATATEIVNIQREARTLLGLAVLSATLLEQKLSMQRVYTILENWFDPTGTKADMIRNEIVSKYRSASREASIPGEGKGRRIVNATAPEQMPEEAPFPEPNPLFDEEEKMQEEVGYPVRITYLNAEQIKNVSYTWYCQVVPKEKESSDLTKVLFGQMMQQIAAFGPDVNLAFLEEEFASIWNKPFDKLFQRQVQDVTGMMMPGAQGQGQQVAGANQKIPGQMMQGMGQPQTPSINMLNQQ